MTTDQMIPDGAPYYVDRAGARHRMPDRNPCTARYPATCPGCSSPFSKGVAIVGIAVKGKRKPWVYRYYHAGCEPGAGSGQTTETTGTQEHETTEPEETGGILESTPETGELPLSGRITTTAQKNGKAPVAPSPPRPGSLEEMVAGIAAQVAEERFTALAETLPRGGAGIVRITLPDGKIVRELTDEHAHPALQEVLELVSARKNVLLVGPAGCGKSHLASQVARSLGRRYGFISCSAGMSEGQMLGRLLPIGEGGRFIYQYAQFVDFYENGGVFLVDEMDGADPNTLLSLNAALANGHCPVPNRPDNPIALRHPDFVCIAAANTFGTGADRMYVGRNQLDESTLDRFRVGTVEMDYDEALEERLCPDEKLRGTLQDIRRRARTAKLRRIVSTRFIADAAEMAACAGWTEEKIVGKLLSGWTADERRQVGRGAA